MDLFDGCLCGLMGSHDKNIAFFRSGGYEDLRLRCSENLRIFHCGVFHILHHLFKVHADLDSAFGFLCVFGSLFSHHAETLCDGGELKTHVGLIDGADIFHIIAILFSNVGSVSFKI